MSNSTIRILMIDDDEQILFALRAVFQFQGWVSLSATDVPSGLELLVRENPDLQSAYLGSMITGDIA